MSDIFEDIFEEYEAENEEPLDEEPPREWGVNFETGQLTGRIAEGSEAIKVWVWNALKTPRYLYEIYSWYYGHDFDELVGNSFSEEYVDAEVKRMLKECLTVNPYIEDVEDITYSYQDDTLHISCKILTEFGEEEIDV